MALRIARSTALAAATFAAAAFPFLAAPAQADADRCEDYLEAVGVEMADAHDLACDIGEAGQVEECGAILEMFTVEAADAQRACELAQQKEPTVPQPA